jgi:hypothetical protein
MNRMFLPLFVGLAFFSSNSFAAEKYTFACTRNDASTSSAGSVPTEYKKRITLTLQGDTATVYWSKRNSEQATLSGGSSKFKNPRYFGLPQFTDCANAGWVEVQRKMLSGQSGWIEITGQGNEDCGIGDVFYKCLAQ